MMAGGDAKHDPISTDIIFNILTRLPAKSLERFRCVSNLWSSLISDHLFVNSHYTRSLTRPGGTSLLISFSDQPNPNRLFFSSTHQQEEEEEDDDDVTTNALHQLRLSGQVTRYISESLNGLICLDIDDDVKICNPSTRKVITLPPTKPETFPVSGFAYSRFNSFGFDPVSNQHKVLSAWVIETGDPQNEMIVEHKVFTLGTSSWRRVHGGPPYEPRVESLCLKGVIHYRCWSNRSNPADKVIVGFNLGNEEFSVIPLPFGASFGLHDSALIRCKGHLAVVDYESLRYDDTMMMWILEDYGDQVWMRKIIEIPCYGKACAVDYADFFPVGTVHTGEILVAPRRISGKACMFYLDMDSNKMRRVNIFGLPDYDFHYVNIDVTNHVESVLPLMELNTIY